jgi:Trypsin-like peptidase domain
MRPFLGSIFCVFVSLIAPAGRAALIPPEYSNAVVAIGVLKTTVETGKPPVSEWVTVGTGFFYGAVVKDDPDPKKRLYEIFLVTARHVVEGYLKGNGGDLQIRVNPKDANEPVKQFTLPTNPPPGGSTWFYHPTKGIDVAIVRVNFNLLQDQGFDANFISADLNSADTKKMKEIGVSAGDGIFLLGFPLNLAGSDRSYIIVRQGIIARISQLLGGASKTFLLDSFAFPGNSGGPVFLKPEITSIEGTKANNNAFLIGLVIQYMSYDDIAVSRQTGQPRVVFQENSGLAEVIPTDQIDSAIVAWRSAHPNVFPNLPQPPVFQFPAPAPPGLDAK